MSDSGDNIGGLRVVVDKEIDQMEAIQADLTSIDLKLSGLIGLHQFVFGGTRNPHSQAMGHAANQMLTALQELIPLAKAFHDEAVEYRNIL